MKFLIKLLKDWKASDGKTYASGITIEVDKAVAAELIMDGTGEKVDKAVEGDDLGRLEKAIDKAMDRQIDKIVDKTAEKIHSIQTKDLLDEDPFHGFLQGYNGGPVTKEAKQFAFGNFCRELEKAGERFVGASPLLKKSLERSKNMITKAAGTGLVIQQDDSAGALVPPELSNMLMTMSDETAVLEPRCAKLSIGTNRIELPHPIDYDRSSGLVHGGVVAYFQSENGALTESRPKMEDIGINLHGLTVLAYASHQTQQFAAVDLGSYLMPRMAAGLTFKKEQKIIHGNGAGEPLGILNAKSKIEVSKESNQTAATIVLKNLYKMEQRLRVESAGGVTWIYNRLSSLTDLRTLFLATGTAGVQTALFSGNPFSNTATLDSIPIAHTEHCEAIGTVGDLILADLGQYLFVSHKSGIEVASSIHLKFDYAQTAWRMITYIGGQVFASKVYTNAKGLTSAPVITLAERA